MKNLIIFFVILCFPFITHAEWKFVKEYAHGGSIVSIEVPDTNNCYFLLQDDDSTFLYKYSGNDHIIRLVNRISPFDEDPPIVLGAHYMSAPDKDHLFISFDSGRNIRKSTDGGKTFKRICI